MKTLPSIAKSLLLVTLMTMPTTILAQTDNDSPAKTSTFKVSDLIFEQIRITVANTPNEQQGLRPLGGVTLKDFESMVKEAQVWAADQGDENSPVKIQPYLAKLSLVVTGNESQRLAVAAYLTKLRLDYGLELDPK